MSFRSLCDLLDSWTCGSAPGWPQVRTMRGPEIQTLAAAPRRPQLRHKPDHLLVQRRGNVDHHQEPDVLRSQWDEETEVVQSQHSTRLRSGDNQQPEREHSRGQQGLHTGDAEVLKVKSRF